MIPWRDSFEVQPTDRVERSPQLIFQLVDPVLDQVKLTYI